MHHLWERTAALPTNHSCCLIWGAYLCLSMTSNFCIRRRWKRVVGEFPETYHNFKQKHGQSFLFKFSFLKFSLSAPPNCNTSPTCLFSWEKAWCSSISAHEVFIKFLCRFKLLSYSTPCQICCLVNNLSAVQTWVEEMFWPAGICESLISMRF